ncbi:hypothetical protein L7F22_015222 [Adiantum nelumboides]|nr:hypothetical protein [Adiantum nelumboides]
MVKAGSPTRETLVAAAIPNACRKLLQMRPNLKAQYNKKKSSLVRAALEYLTSDSFMYGPLLTPPQSPVKPAKHKHSEKVGNTGTASQIEGHAGGSTLSSLHSPPSTPISRMRTMSTLTRKILGRRTPNNEESGQLAAPSSAEAYHKHSEEALLLPPLNHKEKLFDKSEANGNGGLTSQGEDDEEVNEEDDDEESSKSFTESQSESDITPLHKEASMEVARKLVRKVGGRLSKELGIFVDARDCDVERWFLATTFMGQPSDFELSKQMFKKLQSMGISKIEDVLTIGQSQVEEAFQNVMHHQRIASRLQKIALALRTERNGGLCSLKRVPDYLELKRDLENLPGYSKNAARTFIRELRGVWPGANPDFETRTRNAAKHLHLLSSSNDGSEATSNLIELGQDAGLDVRDLELALVKLSFQHARHYRNCPGGRECEFARITLSDVDHLLANL